MQPIHPFSITAPGFAGVNTQDSPVDMDMKFALEANNCIIDKSGRIGARKGWETVAATATVGDTNVGAIGECVSASGVSTIIVCAGNGIHKLTGSTLTLLTYGGGGVAPTITSNNWQMCTLNGALLMFQQGYDALLYDPATSTTTYRRVSEHATYSGTLGKNNCGIAAYGRIWSARSDTDTMTLQWSDTLTFQKWTAGTAGSLNLYGVWPQGGDEIIALAAHNNQLIIFGRKQTLIYTGAKDPSTMTLYDAIGNSGCAGRDTVQNTPSDLVYLSFNGLQSLARTIQEKSAPLVSMSRTVNDDIKAYVAETVSSSNIKAIYSPVDAFYLLTFTEYSVVFCFDMRTPMQDGSQRATTWYNIAPQCFCYGVDNILYLGKPGWLAKYGGYTDNGTAYRMTYYSPWIDFGDPIRSSILKRINTSIAGRSTSAVVFKWGFDYVPASVSGSNATVTSGVISEYNISEFGIGEYTRGGYVRVASVPAAGSGKVIQFGIECQVTGYPISVQRMDIFTKDGAYK